MTKSLKILNLFIFMGNFPQAAVGYILHASTLLNSVVMATETPPAQ